MEELQHTGYIVSAWPYIPQEESLKWITLQINLNKPVCCNLGNSLRSEPCYYLVYPQILLLKSVDKH